MNRVVVGLCPYFSMDNVWTRPTRPLTVLAPLAGFTDSIFRQICRSYGADIVVSEMASVAALVHNPGKALERLKFVESERPYIVQLFGAKPDQFGAAARLITDKIKPDGLDINYGCPAPKIIKEGAGAALGADLPRARQVAQAVLGNTDLPVSIKLRAQNKEISAQQLVAYLADLPLAAVTVHGRSVSGGFSGPTDPAAIAACRPYVRGVLIANGGIVDLTTAKMMLQISLADGIMIGRGALSRPWIFQEIKKQQTINLSWAELTELIRHHAQLIVAYKGEAGLIEFRKFLAWYVKGWPQAKYLREQLMQIKTLSQLEDIITSVSV